MRNLLAIAKFHAIPAVEGGTTVTWNLRPFFHMGGRLPSYRRFPMHIKFLHVASPFRLSEAWYPLVRHTLNFRDRTLNNKTLESFKLTA